MQWSDNGIVLGARRHGESSVILELMTREHGRHHGLLHGGRSQRLQPVIQPGNTVQAVWRARLDDYLGSYTVEPVAARAARLMASPLALYGVATMAALLRQLPERDPHPGLYDVAEALVAHLDEPAIAPALFVSFELAVLSELGFGLDLSCCAVTGATEDLRFVSPKSGRAVSEGAAGPYRERLLPLPAFLAKRGDQAPDPAELRAGFGLTGFFLDEHVFRPQGARLPEERTRLVAAALRAS